MTKLQLLHRALNERMMAAVEQIMEMVGGTVLEYEEETARVRKENEVLKRRLQWMDEGNRANWSGPSELVAHSTPDASNPSQPEESAVSFEFGQESQTVVIKTEFSDHPLVYARPVNSLSMLPQNTNQESAIAGTSTDVNYSQTESMTWPSNQSYMEPLEFDPTSSTSISCSAGRGKRQRMSFACPDCGKVFGREQGLLFHMRTHSKEKPYAYRRRKACFYGDGTRKKKLRGLSQISGGNAADLLDDPENANSPSSEHPDEEWEADSPSDNSDQTNNANNPESIASNPVPLQRQRRKKKNKCRCPLCGQRFHKVDDLEFHMKSHMAVAKQSLHNLPNKAQPGRERKVAEVSSRCFSKVWAYYMKTSNDRVVCKVCSAKISQGSSSASRRNTSNMWSHLKGKHLNNYLEAKGYINPVNSLINIMNQHESRPEVKLELCEQEESKPVQEFKEGAYLENLSQLGLHNIENKTC